MSNTTSHHRHHLGISVAWSYVFAMLLMLFVFLILVPDADGPSPWDGQAFRSGVLEMAANFRVLDDLADVGLVKVADVGEGWLDAELDLIVVSDRRFGVAPFYLALLFVSASLLLRGIRQRLLARHFGGAAGRGQMSSYFFGRGLNLFFPFGPGELGTAQALVEGGMAPQQAATVAFHNRLFELLALLLLLVASFAYLGWEGAVLPACWGLVLVVAVVTLTRPLGGSDTTTTRWNPFAHVWSALNGRALAGAVTALAHSPSFFASVGALSLVTLGLEILGYWCIKQAFSSPMDDYVLMKDLPFVHFAIVILIANMTRVLPYTFGSVGIYEIVSVAMFRAFDEGFLAGMTVSLLDAFLVNGLSAIAFVVALWLGRCPSVFDTWHAFFVQSGEAVEAVGAHAEDALGTPA